MKINEQYDCKPIRLSDGAKARLRLCAELLGVLLAMLLLIAAVVVTVKVLCQRSVDAHGATTAATGHACVTARVIDAVVSNVGNLVARSRTPASAVVATQPCHLRPASAKGKDLTRA